MSPGGELHVNERRKTNHRHPSRYERMLERLEQKFFVATDRNRIYRNTARRNRETCAKRHDRAMVFESLFAHEKVDVLSRSGSSVSAYGDATDGNERHSHFFELSRGVVQRLKNSRRNYAFA